MPYGVRFFRNTGAASLEDDETFNRLVHSEKISEGFDGTISIPDFDSDKGLFTISYYLSKFRIDSDTRVSDSTSWSSQDYLHPHEHPVSLPSLNWDNSTKVMTISPQSLPSDWTRTGSDNNADYLLMFFHHR